MPQFFQQGGPAMWPLLGMSVWVVWLVLERSIWWFRQREEPRVAFERVCRRHLGARELAPATLEEALALDARRAERGLASFEVIVAAAPMLGILGTVLGIIQAFGLLAARSDVDPLGVSEGVSQALISTATGLVVALAALFSGHFFRLQAERRAETLELEGRRRLSSP